MPHSSNFLKHESVQYWVQVARWSVLFLLVFELVIRIFILKYAPSEFKAEWGVIPIAGSHSLQGLEGFGVLRFLANGEVQTPYQGGISIVVLGDSTVYAAQVNAGDNFVSLTEVALRERNLKVDLHNLGHPERSVADYVFLAPAVNAAYAPEYVIIQASLANFSLSYDKSRENYFVDKGNGALTLVHRGAPAGRDMATQHVLSPFGLTSFWNFRVQNTAKEMKIIYPYLFSSVKSNASEKPETTVKNPAVQPEENPKYPFLEQVSPQVRALKDAYSNSNIIFLVIPYVPSISAGLDPKISWVSPMDQALSLFLDQKEGVDVIYTRDVFQKYYKKYKVLPRGSFNSQFNFGHLNLSGHLAVAQALTETLGEILK